MATAGALMLNIALHFKFNGLLLPLLETVIFFFNILPVHLSITSFLLVDFDYYPAKIHHFNHKTTHHAQKLKTED